MKSTNIRRVKSAVCDAEARKRLEEYRKSHGPGPHRAAILADVIWTDEWRDNLADQIATDIVLGWMHLEDAARLLDQQSHEQTLQS